MKTTREKVTFYLTASVYVVFNLQLAGNLLTTVQATLSQILLTAPFVIGITCVIVGIIQYAAGGEKVPWVSRLRLFFTIGIFAGLVYAIYDYTSKGVPQ